MAAKTTPAKKTAAKKVVARKTTKQIVRVPRTKAVEIHAYIPAPEVQERYVGRKVYGVYDAVLADVAVRDKKNILLEGDTGSGKTLFGEAYASLRKRLYYRIPCDVSMTPSALFGKYIMGDDGKFHWQNGPVTQVVRYGGVLNISEINMMSPKIAASLYPLLDGNRYIPLIEHNGEIVRAHSDLLIIGDMNPHYRGTMELNAAFRNRFKYKIKWGYDKAVEEKLVNMPTLRKIAHELREMRGKEINTPVSTNMLMEYESIAVDELLGVEFARENFIAAFSVSEADSISKVLDLNKTNIDKEAAALIRIATQSDENDEDLEEIDWQQEQQS